MFLISYLTRQREMIAGLPLALATDYNPGFYSIRKYEFVVTACKNENDSRRNHQCCHYKWAYAMEFLKLTEASQ
jgi:hypothetical protein